MKAKEDMDNPTGKQLYIMSTNVNCFHYLYQDAELLLRLAKEAEGKSFQQVPFSRTAILLYVFSLEALINRAMAEFLPEHIRDFYSERERDLSLEDKWELLPLLLSDKFDRHFDKSSYPWNQFAELIKIRNDFVHPKQKRQAYMRIFKRKRFDSLCYYLNELPAELGIKVSDLIYPQTRIPKDPYSILPRDIEKAKKITDDVVMKLDELLSGRITSNNWLRNDQLDLIWPNGARLDQVKDEDLPEYNRST
jgi:hypothetical protein